MKALDKVYSQLPDTFTRQQVINEAKKQGYSFGLASSLPAKMIYEDLVTREDHGHYRKNTN